MHARVVRFTDVTPERIDEIIARVEQEEGPPEGVESTGFQLFYDESQGTALFIGHFEDEEKMRAANEIFEQMDASDTPGTRASVDQAELKLERSA
jgi:hypothetical protein